jgi:uncharacterized protein (DUF2062 family)
MLRPVREAIVSGMTPQSAALSIAIGVTGGVWPVWGTQFVACVALGALLGGKFVLYMAVSQLMSGIAVALIPMFIRLGEAVLIVEERFDAAALVSGLKEDPIGTLRTTWAWRC